MLIAPPHPLDKYGLKYDQFWTQNYEWIEQSGSLGLRIYGDPVSPAPLPGTIPLLGSALAILWVWRKKCSA